MDNSLFPQVDKIEVLRSRDGRMAQLIERFGYIDRPTDEPLFETFTESIVSQQVSLAATHNIMERLKAASGGITPEHLAAMSVEHYRSCGLSERKAVWLRNAAARFADGEFDKERLAKMSDEEVVAALTRLDGVGVWTAEMLLIFSLGRTDILSEKDLIIRRALQTLYGLKRLTARRWAHFRALYSPYCSIASFYLWAYGNSLPKHLPTVVVRRLNFKKLKNKTLHYSFIETRYGTMLAGSVSSGICWLNFADDRAKALEQLRGEFRRADMVEGADRFTAELQKALECRQCGVLKLSLQGTPFELKVWRELLRIPRGVTVSYSEVTERAGLGRAFRAVGNAVGANPVVVIVPCHRVIRADGDIGEFSGGVEKKLLLLASERD